MPDAAAPARGWLRLVMLGVATAWLWWGPFTWQVLGRNSTIFRPWMMFSGAGIPLCDVRYEAGDDRTPLDRFALLGGERSTADPLWRIEDAEHARAVGERICDALGPAADVRVTTRCASVDGWVDALDGAASICDAP